MLKLPPVVKLVIVSEHSEIKDKIKHFNRKNQQILIINAAHYPDAIKKSGRFPSGPNFDVVWWIFVTKMFGFLS